MEMGASIQFIHLSKQPPQVDEDISYIYMDNDLFKAVEAGNIEELFRKYEGDLRCLVDEMLNTVLHIHCRASSGNLSVKTEFSHNFVKQLVDKCSTLLQQTNAEGEIPFHVAARYGHSMMVKFIIECTKQLEHREDLEKGSTSAAPSSRIKQMLRMTDEKGNTPLHKAVESRNADVVRLLVKELGPDFPFSSNKSGETPLYLAAKRGNVRSVESILENCNSMAMDFSGPNGTTVLHAAVMGGKEMVEIVRKLIEMKKDLMRERDDKGRIALHYAAHLGYPPIVRVVLEIDPSLGYVRDKERGSTPLHMAAWKGYIRTMEEIIKYCPGCCDIVDKKCGWNFLHFAFVALDHKGFKRLLLSDGDGNKFKDLPIKDLLNVMDDNGNTPLDVMCLGPAYSLTFDYDNYEVSKLFRAYDDISISDHTDNIWKMMIKKQQIWESLKEIGNNVKVAGTKVDDFFFLNMEEPDKNRKEALEAIDKAREAHLVVVALIATVTFAAAFTLPGGYNQNGGTAIMTHHSAFQAFLITDTLAFISSLLAIFLHFLLMYVRSTKFQVEWIVAADALTFVAMIAMLIAFSTGTYAVLKSSIGFAVTTCSLALTFILGVLVSTYYWCKIIHQ